MKNLFLIFLILIAFDCNNNRQEKVLEKKIDSLRLKADFSPMAQSEAYDFINEYYIPKLQSGLSKYKLYIHPLKGKDFTQVFKRDSVAFTLAYFGKNTDVITIPPPIAPILFDTTQIWNYKKLKNIQLVTDSLLKSIYKLPINERRKAWAKNFDNGYMNISYPQYNKHSKRLVVRQWFENGDWCGTGREHFFWYSKVAGGWQLDSTRRN